MYYQVRVGLGTILKDNRKSSKWEFIRAVSSPSCANFALREADERKGKPTTTSNSSTVKRNFCIDDCLKSVPGEYKAIPVTDDLRKLVEKGGFNLTKWVSNSRRVIESLPVSERAGTFKDLHDGELPIERAQGYVGTLNVTSCVSRLKLKANRSQEEIYFQLFFVVRSPWFRSPDCPPS